MKELTCSKSVVYIGKTKYALSFLHLTSYFQCYLESPNHSVVSVMDHSTQISSLLFMMYHTSSAILAFSISKQLCQLIKCIDSLIIDDFITDEPNQTIIGCESKVMYSYFLSFLKLNFNKDNSVSEDSTKGEWISPILTILMNINWTDSSNLQWNMKMMSMEKKKLPSRLIHLKPTPSVQQQLTFSLSS